MRLVLDTNVLVSALLRRESVPDVALSAILARATVLYDSRVIDEYRRVLARPKFASIDRARIDAKIAAIATSGEDVGERVAFAGALRDEDDRVFVEVALAGRADAIVTGNLRDYPLDLGFDVHPPATILALLSART